MKIYEVDVVIKRKMLVVAKDETGAHRAADAFLFVFLEDTIVGDPFEDAEPDNIIDVTEDPAVQDSIPYGVDDDDPRRDWTVAEWRKA